MESISETKRIPDREIFYQRARTQNRIFDKLVTFFAERAEDSGITKRDIADRLGRDPAQITRWLSSPSNITIDTISDLLLALEAELDATVHGFADRPTTNYTHPWMEEYWEAGKPSPGVRSKRAGASLIGDLKMKHSSQTSTNASAVQFELVRP